LSDLTFTIPLPPRDDAEQNSYLNDCKSIAWGAVGELEEDEERRSWPTQEKVRCEVRVFGPTQFSKAAKELETVAKTIGGVLWHPEKSKTLLTFEQRSSDKPRIEVSVTRRKLVSNESGTHYEF